MDTITYTMKPTKDEGQYYLFKHTYNSNMPPLPEGETSITYSGPPIVAKDETEYICEVSTEEEAKEYIKNLSRPSIKINIDEPKS